MEKFGIAAAELGFSQNKEKRSKVAKAKISDFPRRLFPGKNSDAKLNIELHF